MSDIVERLRLLMPSDSSGASIEAANTIAALRAEVERLLGIVDGFSLDPDYIKLTNRVEDLRGVLRDITELFAANCEINPNNYITYRNARAALEEK